MTAIRIETIAIGDELLTGKISDTNSQQVADSLFQRGLRLQRSSVIADEIPQIQATLRERAGVCDLLLCFGGLGPTSDDKTAEAVAGLLGTPLISDLATRERLEAFCRTRGRELTPQMLKQTILPEGTVALNNPVGLAVGFSFVLADCRLYFLPGVPAEMKAMFAQSVIPHLENRLGETEVLKSHCWRCLGVPESELQRAMDPIEARLPRHAWLGYRTRFPENHLTLYWRKQGGGDEAGFAERVASIGRIVAPWCYSEENKELEEIVVGLLAKRGASLALAESCTGGLVVQRLTRVPGSSQHIWGGYTCYQVAAKQTMLDVVLENPSDAVSQACTRNLAEQAKKKSGCQIAAAITGYMGPSGGTHTDPLGTSYLCVVGDSDNPILERKQITAVRDREQNQWGAATHLLNAIRIYLGGHKTVASQ